MTTTQYHSAGVAIDHSANNQQYGKRGVNILYLFLITIAVIGNVQFGLAQMVLNPLQTVSIRTLLPGQDGSPRGAVPTDMEVDYAGNIISVGTYNPEILEPIYMSAGSTMDKYYIIKYGAGGQALWGKNLASSDVTGLDIDSDSNGNIYSAGTNATPNVFISKILSDGTYGPSVTLPATNYEWQVVSLAVSSDNIYVLRAPTSSVVVDPADRTHTASGKVLTVYNSSLQFIRTIPLPSVNIMAFTMDPGGNIFITGTFTNTVDFNPDPAIVNNLTANTSGASSESLFLAKYSNSGALLWADKMGDPTNKALPNSIYADVNGNVYLTGPFIGTINSTLGGGLALTSIGSNPNLFALKIAQSGGTSFSVNFPTNLSPGVLTYSTIQKGSASIKTDANGAVYIAGTFSGTVDFDPSNSVSAITQNTFMYFGGSSGFITKFSSGGQFLWVSLQAGERLNSFDFNSNRNLIVQVADRLKYVPQVSIYRMCEPPAITLTSSLPAVCQQSNVSLTASGGVSYAWFSPFNPYESSPTKDVAMNSYGQISLSVTGKDIYGCTADKTVTVTVYPKPNVFITAGAYVFCEGTSTTLTGNGASTYSWSPSAGLSSTTGTQVTATPLTNSTYNVIGTSTDGCPGSSSVSLTVRPKTLVFTANKTTICYDAQNPTGANNAVNLTASGASSAANYTWSKSPNTGSTVPSVGATQYTDFPLNTTTYTVTALTNSNSCQETKSISVPVYNPALSVSINSAVLCAGTSVPITASGATSYSWSPALGLSSTTASQVTAMPATTTTYSVTGPDVNGCTATKNVTVTVNALPPTPTISGTSTNICNTFPSLTGSSATSYLWSTGATSQSITASGGGQYSVTVTNASGCSTASSPFTVYDYRPSISVLATTTITPCSPSGRLTSSAGSSYQWLRNGSAIGGNSNYFDVTRGGSYTVSIVSPTGCPGVTLTSPTVSVEDKFVQPITTQYTCPGTSLSLYASPSGGTWSGPGVSGSTFYSTTAGTYYLTYTYNFNGCVQSTPATVIVNPQPVITSFEGPSSVCPGNPYTYRVYTSGTVTSIDWQKPSNWTVVYQGGNELRVTVPSNSPDYGAVRAVVSNGSCSTSDGVTVGPGSCGGGGYYYAAYPNPTSSELTVESTEAVEEPTYLTLFDQFGKEVYIAAIKAGDQQTKLVTDNLAAGVYWLQFRNSKRRELKKIVVVHPSNK
jgi:hypothetical protein